MHPPGGTYFFGLKAGDIAPTDFVLSERVDDFLFILRMMDSDDADVIAVADMDTCDGSDGCDGSVDGGCCGSGG